MIGQIVNYRYEVLEKIGDGDFFSVYKSRDKVLNRLVALKVFRKEVADNDGFVRSVLAGYRAVSGLDHPNIARVIEADPESPERFITCEFAHGTSVKERLRRAGPIAPPLALDIIIGVLEALEYAHANRVVHGDLRPQDVLVSPDGEVKVTDFGLSWALRRHSDIADKYAMRSVHYEAPEIVEGAEPSVASDLYSVGVILYEMLTATLPFDGATAVAVAIKQAKDIPVPPRNINTGVPKSLSDLVMRSLEKSPADRFPNASAMLADLRAIRDAIRLGRPLSIPQPAVSAKLETRLEPHPPVKPVEPSLRRSIVLLMLLFVVVVLVSTLSVTIYLRSESRGVRVPPLLGMTWDEAVQEAQKVGLHLENAGEAYSNTYAEGQICSVVPPAGSLIRPDEPVRVRISKGPSRRPVPDLRGLSEAEAYKVAAENKFNIGKVTAEYSDTVPVNAVISQNPEPGVMRAPDSSISLVVSLGPKPEPVEPTEPETIGQERRYNVAVEVPEAAEGLQEVRIIVEDDRGETIVYQRYHEPGERFTESVTTYGSPVRIRVYVGDQLARDVRYR